MPNGGSGWPNLYSVNGTVDALTALIDLDDWRFDDHGQIVLDDGTISVTAYATEAAAAAAQAAQPGVTIELLFTGDQMMQRIENDIENR